MRRPAVYRLAGDVEEDRSGRALQHNESAVSVEYVANTRDDAGRGNMPHLAQRRMPVSAPVAEPGQPVRRRSSCYFQWPNERRPVGRSSGALLPTRRRRGDDVGHEDARREVIVAASTISAKRYRSVAEMWSRW